MSQELYYTSAPRGLRPGSSGFCTVAATAGMPRALVERLESLSGYNPPFPPGSPREAENPVACAHWRVPAGGRSLSVLSRVAPAGLDHTARPNKLAYHVVLSPGEQPAAGPAWAMMQPGVMERAWSGEPRTLPEGRKVIPAGDATAGASDRWAGVLAESFPADAARPAYLVHNAGFDPLPLLHEAIVLLPPRVRWRVTFNTYFTELPAGLDCAWRCVLAGTPAAAEDARPANALVIDLTRAANPSRSERLAHTGGAAPHV